jgi:hypothetical protein
VACRYPQLLCLAGPAKKRRDGEENQPVDLDGALAARCGVELY